MAESLSLSVPRPYHSLGSALCTLIIATLAALLVWRGLNGLRAQAGWWCRRRRRLGGQEATGQAGRCSGGSCRQRTGGGASSLT